MSPNMPYQTVSTWDRGAMDVQVGVEDGSFWLVRRGTMRGPKSDHIPSWCVADSGPWGLWQPFGLDAKGRVYWKRLIRPETEPTETEQLAELYYDDEE